MHPNSRLRATAAVVTVAATAAITWSVLTPSGIPAHQEIATASKPLPPVHTPGAIAATPALTMPVAEKVAEKPAVLSEIPTPAANIIGSQWQSQSQAECLAFSNWATRYLATPVAERKGMLAEGVVTATARRAVLAKMIRENPEQALAAAVPVMVRKELPAPITDLLEERVSGKGLIGTLSGTPRPGSDKAIATTRKALVGRSEYEAFSYGRRAQLSYLPDVSILGIALDRSLAVSDSPVRVLEAGETADDKAVEEVCLISGDTTPVEAGGALNTHQMTAVETNGKIQMVCKPAHVSKLEARLIGGEGLLANGAPGSSGVVGRPSYAWTHGPKKVLLIRIDFSDMPGIPVNDGGSGTVVTPEVAVDTVNGPEMGKEFFEQASYGQTTLVLAPLVAGVSNDVTPVLRMPLSANTYALGGDNFLLHTDAQALATAAGYTVANYDRIGVIFSGLWDIPGSLFGYSGLAITPGKEFWSNGTWTRGIIAHEVGHNYGLNHSSLWLVNDGNPVSATGTTLDYGDNSDVMGSGPLFSNQYSQWNRSICQWLPDAAVSTISSSGTYRVHRFDSPAANLASTLTLKVVRNRTEDYWIGYRRSTPNENYNNGAYIVWGANENSRGRLLDFNTPGGGDNGTPDDAPLAVGQSFNDTANGITLTTVARGGSGVDEYLDVQVAFQPRLAWTSSTYLVDEQAGSVPLTLTRSNNSTGAVSVHWATAPGSATSPADFTASSGDVSWANGDGADKTIYIPIVADSSPEGTQNFTVTLSAPTGGSVIVDNAVATVSILEPGANDPSYSSTFINNTVAKVLVQPDGKLLIGGYFSQVGDNSQQGIARLTATGAVDPGFAIGGAGTDTFVVDIARQPDGKILVCGDFSTMMGVARNRIARLNVDGTLDASFNPGTGADGTVNAVIVQPDGKVLIGGEFTNVNGSAREYVARLNADGSLDTGFTGPDFAGTGGWRVASLALQADGKLLVGGVYYFDDGGAGICRVTTSGARDSTFDGVTSGPQNGGFLSRVNSVALQLDGKILITGDFASYNGEARRGFARLSNTGALDGTWTASANGDCGTVLVQPDGKIVVGGSFSTFGGSSASSLVRLSSSGVVDTAFTAAGGLDGTILSLAMQADGKIAFGCNYTTFQTKGPAPLFRMFGGLSGLPGTLQLSSPTVSTTEGGSIAISVTRSGGSSGAMSVNYSTVLGTAGAADFTPASGTLSWANGDAAAKTITIPITTDAPTEAPETFTVNLGQPLLGGAILGATQSTTVSIIDPGAITAYQTWREAKFTVGELANAAISGSQADPDGDGIVNLLEFAQGLAPKTSSQVGTPIVGKQLVSGSTYLTLTFRRQITAPELTYSAQVNGTLPGTWAGGSVIVGSPVSNGDGTETVTYRDTVAQTAASHRFMRLQVTLAP